MTYGDHYKEHISGVYSLVDRERKPRKGLFLLVASDTFTTNQTIFNRRSYDVQRLNVAQTDISGRVMLTLEAVVPVEDLLPFTERLRKPYVISFGC